MVLVFLPILILCSAPNPDTVLIIQTPLGVFSAKSLIQNKKKSESRLICSNRVKIEEVPTVETTDVEPFSAARCRVFKRSNNNRKVNLHERLKCLYILSWGISLPEFIPGIFFGCVLVQVFSRFPPLFPFPTRLSWKSLGLWVKTSKLPFVFNIKGKREGEGRKEKHWIFSSFPSQFFYSILLYVLVSESQLGNLFKLLSLHIILISEIFSRYLENWRGSHCPLINENLPTSFKHYTEFECVQSKFLSFLLQSMIFLHFLSYEFEFQ